jgi:hypothetical protein
VGQAEQVGRRAARVHQGPREHLVLGLRAPAARPEVRRPVLPERRALRGLQAPVGRRERRGPQVRQVPQALVERLRPERLAPQTEPALRALQELAPMGRRGWVAGE